MLRAGTRKASGGGGCLKGVTRHIRSSSCARVSQGRWRVKGGGRGVFRRSLEARPASPNANPTLRVEEVAYFATEAGQRVQAVQGVAVGERGYAPARAMRVDRAGFRVHDPDQARAIAEPH